MTVTSKESRVEAARKAIDVHSRRIRELREEERAACRRMDFAAATDAAIARSIEQHAYEIARAVVIRGGN